MPWINLRALSRSAATPETQHRADKDGEAAADTAAKPAKTKKSKWFAKSSKAEASVAIEMADWCPKYASAPGARLPVSSPAGSASPGTSASVTPRAPATPARAEDRAARHTPVASVDYSDVFFE